MYILYKMQKQMLQAIHFRVIPTMMFITLMVTTHSGDIKPCQCQTNGMCVRTRIVIQMPNNGSHTETNNNSLIALMMMTTMNPVPLNLL